MVVGLLAAGFMGLSGTYTDTWSGAYPYVACEFTFQDSGGNPIEGVTLQVVYQGDPAAVEHHHWPIDDLYPGRIPTSTQEGVVIFHCCAHGFGGTCHTYFHFIKSGRCGAPKYICRFVLRGQVIHSVSFNDLAFPDNAEQLPRIKKSLALPSPDQVSDGNAIPPISALAQVEREFMLVKRLVVIGD